MVTVDCNCNRNCTCAKDTVVQKHYSTVPYHNVLPPTTKIPDDPSASPLQRNSSRTRDCNAFQYPIPASLGPQEGRQGPCRPGKEMGMEDGFPVRFSPYNAKNIISLDGNTVNQPMAGEGGRGGCSFGGGGCNDTPAHARQSRLGCSLSHSHALNNFKDKFGSSLLLPSTTCLLFEIYPRARRQPCLHLPSPSPHLTSDPRDICKGPFVQPIIHPLLHLTSFTFLPFLYIIHILIVFFSRAGVWITYFCGLCYGIRNYTKKERKGKKEGI
ncbi:hypothetical protein F5884DRAFT_460507 [Xylogone sp. PMI_703]|nr:hypothetical protein F5884DRAFT_460507 [Xylogone sp. PMI_703]